MASLVERRLAEAGNYLRSHGYKGKGDSDDPPLYGSLIHPTDVRLLVKRFGKLPPTLEGNGFIIELTPQHEMCGLPSILIAEAGYYTVRDADELGDNEFRPMAYVVTDHPNLDALSKKMDWETISRRQSVFRTERGANVKVVRTVDDILEADKSLPVAVLGATIDFVGDQLRSCRRHGFSEIAADDL